jgi:hypothetical protein
MSSISTVFIVEPRNSQGWIIERLMRDIASELTRRGIQTRIGDASEYGGEDVVFNSHYLVALSDARARVNSLFITHIDDRAKEQELRTSFGRFNSFVCLSPHDAEFLVALKGDPAGVSGIELPARELTMRPLKIAFFSARYPDGRKNEQWILDCFRDRSADERAAFIFSFIGWGWESFCEKLAELDMNYEVHRYSRHLPDEYQMYKDALRSADLLIYPGFDGGAMSVYDALNAGISVLASDISYHRGLGDEVTLFANRSEFFARIDELLKRQNERSRILRDRSIQSYVDRLLSHWSSVMVGRGNTGELVKVMPPADRDRTLQNFRAHYKSMLSPTRVRSFLIRWVQARMIGNRR